MLLLQGLDDPVVPPAQAQAIAATLAAHGIRHAYLAFEGESHGFRRAETIISVPGGRAVLLRPESWASAPRHPAGALTPAGWQRSRPGGHRAANGRRYG